jgi:hypothetical protein
MLVVLPPSKNVNPPRIWVPFAVLIATVFLIGLYAIRTHWPPDLMVGTWVEKSGEAWKIGADDSIETTNSKYPHRSYRWNSKPTAIHLFYESNQQYPVGAFEVEVSSDTLILDPLFVKGPGRGPSILRFRRVSEPPGDPVPVIVAITAVVEIVAFFWWLQRRRNARSN